MREMTKISFTKKELETMYQLIDRMYDVVIIRPQIQNDSRFKTLNEIYNKLKGYLDGNN